MFMLVVYTTDHMVFTFSTGPPRR